VGAAAAEVGGLSNRFVDVAEDDPSKGCGVEKGEKGAALGVFCFDAAAAGLAIAIAVVGAGASVAATPE